MAVAEVPDVDLGSDDGLVLELYHEELKLAKQQEDDAAALALQLSENGEGLSDSIGSDTTTITSGTPQAHDGDSSSTVADNMSDPARSLITDGDREVALHEAFQNARAANICKIDAQYAGMYGRYEQAKCPVDRLDKRRGKNFRALLGWKMKHLFSVFFCLK